MSNFIVFCESCDTEYKLVPMGDEFRDPPTVCSFCGSDLDDNNAVDSQEELDFDGDDEENWEKLVEESFEENSENWDDN
jgi:hypothetical protein